MRVIIWRRDGRWRGGDGEREGGVVEMESRRWRNGGREIKKLGDWDRRD